jgi:hypothetical protein
MARGRMLSKSLSTSAKVARLYVVCPKLADWVRVLFPLMVAHADDHGRLQGDEQTVKLQVDPISPRRLSDFVAALHLMHEVGLITWYVVGDRKVIEIVKFFDHQDLKGHENRPWKLPPCPGPEALIGRNRRDEESRIQTDLVPVKTSIKPDVGESSPNFPQTSPKEREEKGTEEKGRNSADSAEKAPSRVREFLTWFQAEYKARRNGAVYFVKWESHGKLVKDLLRVHEFDRLKKHAQLLLTTDEEWTSETDRGIGILSSRISWLEERLCAWEAKRRAREVV